MLNQLSPSSAGARSRLTSLAASLVVVVGVATLAPAAAADQKNLVQCRQYDADFDYTGVLTECGVAAGDPRTTPTERLEVFRLLGFAHTALGSEKKAGIWYLRLLALDPTYKLGREVSPRFREGFAKAKRKFKKEGRVRASHAPVIVDDKTPVGEPLPLEVTLADPLSRVTTVIATITATGPKATNAKPLVQDVILERDESETGTISFVGALPPLEQLRPEGATGDVEVKYELTLQSGMGAVVKPKPKLAAVKFTIDAAKLVATGPTEANPNDVATGNEAGATTTTTEDESEGLGTGALVGIGVSSAAVVGILVTAAVGGSVAFVCLQNERCTAPAPRSRPASSARVNVN